LPSGVRFEVTDRRAPRRACRDGIADIARSVMADARAGTPVDTGTLRGAWRTRTTADDDTEVSNATPYARFVEYGTRHMAPRAMLGKALARARGSG
jgi:HK97 gp10 family phage protein